VLLSLALVAGEGEVGDEERENVFEIVDRRKMWLWLGRLKQRDGGFRMSEGGEEDVR
jgi:protein farnesyltransferase subunit beta